jgi:tellurite resistance protein
MFEKDAIHQRGQALEDEFFHRVDEKLRQELRAQLQREEARARLTAMTGFEGCQLLDHLIDAGFSPSSLAALALLPAVFVAWADGDVKHAERQLILSAALHRGIKEEPTAFSMIEAWLAHRPPQSLWELWKEYFHALSQSMAPTLATMLHQEIVRLATAVAESSGGYFGRGVVSKMEKSMLDQIAEVN